VSPPCLDSITHLCSGRDHSAHIPDHGNFRRDRPHLAGDGPRPVRAGSGLALAAIEEALIIRRQLAAARPAAFLPDLASSLNNQSLRLADLGRREEALAAIEEAVTIYRQLAAARPAAFLADLASSLNNPASALSLLKREAEASEIREEADAMTGGRFR
jgi:tetratricopeptide (TPR) repeat protein